MRTSLVVIGTIFIVLGALMYFIPLQSARATATTINNGDVNSNVSSASVAVPAGWAISSAIIGTVLLLFGLMASSTADRVSNDRNRVDSERIHTVNERRLRGDGSDHTTLHEKSTHYKKRIH